MKHLFILLISLSLYAATSAQIPNPSFENWTNINGWYPDGWGTVDSTLAPYQFCNHINTGAAAGTSYMRLINRYVSLLGVNVPAMAITGKITFSGTTPMFSGGFPITTRPDTLKGKYFMGGTNGGMRDHIGVLLTKWNVTLNKRDTIAYSDSVFHGLFTTWASFSIPINYLSNAIPDTGMIVLTSGDALDANPGNELDIDDLSFATAPVTYIPNIESADRITLYPNPTKNIVTIAASAIINDLVVSNMMGQIVYSANINANNTTINFEVFSKGIYMVKINGNKVYRLIKL